MTEQPTTLAYSKLQADLRAFHSRYAPRPNFEHQLGDVQVYGITRSKHFRGGDGLDYFLFRERYNLDVRAKEAEDKGLEKVAKELPKNKNRAAIVLADFPGQGQFEFAASIMLLRMIKSKLSDQLRMYGEVTPSLFFDLNQEFYFPEAAKQPTLIYAEMNNAGRGKFISAGHPFPLVFRAKEHSFDPSLEKEWAQNVSYSLGLLPSRGHIDESAKPNPSGHYTDPYHTHKLELAPGDIAIFYTDGLKDHGKLQGKPWYPARMSAFINKIRGESAEVIASKLAEEITAHADLTDDLSAVVVKRNETKSV